MSSSKTMGLATPESMMESTCPSNTLSQTSNSSAAVAFLMPLALWLRPFTLSCARSEQMHEHFARDI